MSNHALKSETRKYIINTVLKFEVNDAKQW